MKKNILLLSILISIKSICQQTTTSDINIRLHEPVSRNIADIRLKKNIIRIHGALATIMKLRGVEYEWKTKSYPQFHHRNGMEIGLVAQEVEEIEPLLVDTDLQGFKSIEYERISVLLIEAVKEQQQLINLLKKQLALQEINIAELKLQMQSKNSAMKKK